MTGRSAHHDTFVIERRYDAAPARVFHAFADLEVKSQWFGGPDDWTRGKHHFDFREGGSEGLSGGPAGQAPHHFNATYHDIVQDQRIVYSYAMQLGTQRISVSLATIEFLPAGKGTLLKLTEQGVFLDGFDDAGGREEGTRGLLDKLGAWLERQNTQ